MQGDIFTAKSQTKQLSYPMIEDVLFNGRIITKGKLNISRKRTVITNCKYPAQHPKFCSLCTARIPEQKSLRFFSKIPVFFKIGVDKRKKMCYNNFCCEGVAQLVRVPA